MNNIILQRKVGRGLFITYIMIIATVYVQISDAGTCALKSIANCKCFDSEQPVRHIVDCSDKGFLDVPHEIPKRTTDLLLDNNKIEQLWDTSFGGGFPNLTMLSIKHNNLSYIEEDSLKNLPSLETLDLYNNSLQENNSLPVSVFWPLSEKLRVLDIRRNLMNRDVDLINYPQAVSSLKALEDLYIDCLENKSLPSSYGNLSNLHRLIFTNGRLQNQTRPMFISSDMFDAVAKLNISEINLAGLGVTFLSVDTLAKVKSLEVLDLSNNPSVNTIKTPLQNILRTLNGTLKRLRLNNTAIGDNATNVVKSICRIGIIELTLDQNSIYDIAPILQQCIGKVQILSIADNYFYERSAFVLDLYSLKYLVGLNISWQHREYDENLGSKTHLRAFTKVKTSRQKRSRKDPHICETGMACPIKVAPNMQWIDMSHYGLHLPSIPEMVLLQNTTLSYVNMAYTGIQKMKSNFNCPDTPMHITPQVETFDLTGNSIQCIIASYFDGEITHCNWDSLKSLYLGKNRLGFTELNDCNKDRNNILGFIKPLRKLEILDLSGNYIKVLREEDFKTLYNIKKLDLSANSLTVWTLQIEHMVNILYLDLSANHISCLPKNATRVLENIQQSRHGVGPITVDLSFNPLLCFCDCLDFYEWLQVTTINVVNSSDYKCTFLDNKVWKLQNLKTILVKLYAQCFGSLWLDLYVSIVFLLFSLITVCTLIYRMRHEIRYIWVKMRLNRDILQKLLSPSKNQYKYDAFVSCEHTDCRFFVKKHLLPELETKNKGITAPFLLNSSSVLEVQTPDSRPSLSFCLAQRDFVLGTPIIDNIVRSIEDSRKVILIVSRNFLESGWCKEEMKIAHQESLDRGRNVIICILMPGIEKNKLPGTVKLIIKHVTCIEWPKDERAQKVFWLMLQKALLEGTEDVSE